MHDGRHGNYGYDYRFRRPLKNVEDSYRMRVQTEATGVWDALFSTVAAKSKSKTFELAEGKFQITIRQVD